MTLYEYEGQECECLEEHMRSVEQRDKDLPECKECGGPMKLLCGNKGGFRLGQNGKVSWAKGGYNTHYGDIKNAEEGRKVF